MRADAFSKRFREDSIAEQDGCQAETGTGAGGRAFVGSALVHPLISGIERHWAFWMVKSFVLRAGWRLLEMRIPTLARPRPRREEATGCRLIASESDQITLVAAFRGRSTTRTTSGECSPLSKTPATDSVLRRQRCALARRRRM
jgi:hypothetical protein